MAASTPAGLRNLPETLGPMAAAYAAYWAALPRVEGVPLKHALDLGAMRKFAPHFIIVERRDGDRFVLRLVGTAVRDLSGVELTGTDPLAVRDEGQREQGRVAYNALLDTPCASWGIVISRTPAGNQVPTEVIAFPLRDEDGTLRFLAGTVEPCAPGFRPDQASVVKAKFLSWPQHRFIDIGFGLPKLSRKKA